MIKTTAELRLLNDDDLKKGTIEKDEISYNDLALESKEIYTSGCIMLNTRDGRTIIVKNRWGCDGIVISQSTYKDYCKWKEEKRKPSLFKRLFGRHS